MRLRVLCPDGAVGDGIEAAETYDTWSVGETPSPSVDGGARHFLACEENAWPPDTAAASDAGDLATDATAAAALPGDDTRSTRAATTRPDRLLPPSEGADRFLDDLPAASAAWGLPHAGAADW